MTSQRSGATFDPDLEFLLMCSASTMGERGTTGGVVSVLEAGGATVGRLDEAGSYIHPFTDLQLGTGGHGGDIERVRWLMRAWSPLTAEDQSTLALHLRAAPASFRSDHGFGARDRYLDGSEGKEGTHGQHRSGVEAQLGEFVGLAFALTPDPAFLALACHDPNPTDEKGNVDAGEAKRRRTAIKDALRAAKARFGPAHERWLASKVAADPMRRTRERRAILPALAPAEATE